MLGAAGLILNSLFKGSTVGIRSSTVHMILHGVCVGFFPSSHKNIGGVLNDFPFDSVMERAVVLVLGGRCLLIDLSTQIPITQI